MEKGHSSSPTDLLWQRDPVANGAMFFDVGLESSVFLGQPRAFLDIGFVTAGSSPHTSLLDILFRFREKGSDKYLWEVSLSLSLCLLL